MFVPEGFLYVLGMVIASRRVKYRQLNGGGELFEFIASWMH